MPRSSASPLAPAPHTVATSRFTSVFSIVAIMLAGLTPASTAWGDQILETNTSSLTTYLVTAKTSEQDVRPLPEQRGVNLDGTLRLSSSLPLMLAGNPWGESWNGQAKLGAIRLDTGTMPIHDVDLALPAPGFSWVIGRSYNCRQKDSGGSYFDSNGPQGRNWFQSSQPEIMLFNGATDADDVLYLIYGADRYIEFLRFDLTSDEFKSKNGAAGVMQFVAGASTEPDTYIYTDQHGNRVWFFGFDGDSSPAQGQIWKMADPAGNVAFVGDATTGSTAISSGYNGSGWIIQAYDSADRRFTYAYTSGNLTEVKAETKASGTWASPSGVVEVGKVNYAYYVNADSNGEDDDLKLVTITTPLTDSAVNTVRKKGYWYYEGSYHATTNPGYVHQIQYVIDFDGYRRYDLLNTGTTDDPLTASEAALKPYAAANFKYDTDRRIVASWFGGACGCSGGTGTGEHAFTYEANGSFSGTSGYDTAWKGRTIVELPDGSYVTQHFDEIGQALGRVISNGDPTGGRSFWPTQAVRNSSGQLTEIDSPANITTYTHSTGTFSSSGSVGLITTFTRVSSGDLTGFVEDTKHKTSSAGSAYLDSSITYSSADKTVGDVESTRPLLASRRVYSTEVTSGTSGSYLTSLGYSMHSSDGVLMPKVITTTNPTVSTGTNGSNSATASKQYLRKDGTTAFTEAADGIFNYTSYSSGQLVKSIADAQTNHGSDFAGGDDPNTDFGITETSSGLRKITSYTYDAQGRSNTTTLPGGMVKKSYYSELGDERLVVLQFNDSETTPSFKVYGPVGYSVLNHHGKPEAQATIKLTSNESTTALTGHIDEGDTNPITAVDVGTVARLSTTIYDKTGLRVDESRLYTSISGPTYDATTYGYDNSGHRWRTKAPDGTIQRTFYDEIGRVSSQRVGRNDNGYTGGEASGPDDTVKVSEIEYDGASIGNSYVTKRTSFIQDNTTGQREVNFAHDVRGRVLLQTNPSAPHTFTKYDNMGRLIASGQFSSVGSITVGSDDPTTETSNRLALSQTFYDERGQVWKSQRHQIDDADGSDDDTLETLNWYDAVGRLVKTDGGQLAKTTYDRLGRTTHRFILAVDNDSGYGDVDDVAGDIVLEEHQTTYDTAEDVVIMTAVISRHHDDDASGTPTTNALDTNADGLPLKYTAANVKGRIQITANWYDRFDRLVDTVRYGTFGGADFNRSGASAARSSTELCTTYVYDTDGTTLSVNDPENLQTRYGYDDAGRQTLVINNYVNGTPSGPTGDDDVQTRYGYTNGHKTSMLVDVDGSGGASAGDQLTAYTFGVIKGTNPGDSKFASGSLLYKVVYPEQVGSQPEADRRVLYAYNAQGQVIRTEDAEGNVLEQDYDTLGRNTHRRLTTLDTETVTDPGSYDNAVLRISMTYDNLGRRSLVTQYDNATVGSGSVTDEVKYTYEDWGHVERIEQDRNSAVGGGSDEYDVSFEYEKAIDGRNTIRRTKQFNPNGHEVMYYFAPPTQQNEGTYDHEVSRVNRVRYGPTGSTTPVAEYNYLGTGHLVGTRLHQSAAFSNRYSGTPGDYPDLDLFNRPITDDWVKDLATDQTFYDIDLTYDCNGNIVRVEDQVYLTGRDVEYTIDNLNRLTKAEEGDWSGSAITSRTRQQIWTLSQTGNWEFDKLDLNGDNDFVDSGENDDDRTHNDVNEITGRDTDDNGTDDYTLSYTKLGQLRDDGQNYTHLFDGFGRLRQVKNRSNGNLVSEYWYNGLGHRIGWKYDTDVDGDVDGSDKRFNFAYDDRWRIVATYRESDAAANPKEQFVYHCAGADGQGSSSYIDSVLLRDKDHNAGWTVAGDGTLEERNYYCQNWRADSVAVLTAGGAREDQARYFAPGVPFGLPEGDVNGDGSNNSNDATAVNNWITFFTYDVKGDLNLDGAVDGTDYTKLTTKSGTTFGKDKLSGLPSATAGGHRVGYAGYQFDPVLAGSKFHVRHRVLDSTLGRWISRDPLGYVDGPNEYLYVGGNSLRNLDPSGLNTLLQCDARCQWEHLQGLDVVVFHWSIVVPSNCSQALKKMCCRLATTYACQCYEAVQAAPLCDQIGENQFAICLMTWCGPFDPFQPLPELPPSRWWWTDPPGPFLANLNACQTNSGNCWSQ